MVYGKSSHPDNARPYMKRVLVVDDSELTAAQARDVLVMLGYAVPGSASSGPQAVERIKRLRPDVVLMDIATLNRPDGIMSAKQIRTELDIPVVLLADHGDEQSIERVREAQADGYVTKPIRSLELKASIEIALLRKESESRFRDLYRELVERTSDLIYVVDGEGKIKYVNDQIVRLGGYSRQESIGKNFASFMTPESLSYSAEIFRRHLGGDDVGPFELSVMDSGGGIHVIEMREHLVWEDGKIVEVHGIGRDVTERKKAEQELRMSEEKFRGVFETSPDFMYISSVDGKILDYNPSARDFFGYTDEEIKTLTILAVYADTDQRKELVDALMANGFVHNHEVRLKKKDGSIIDALATVTVRRDRDGTAVGFQGSVKDITQMKQMERRMLEVEKLSGLGTMVSGIAHELNNPLTAIMGNAELLSMNNDITDRQKKSLDVIMQESSRAAKVVSNLLAFAREHKSERTLVCVNDIVTESLALREYNLRVNNINVELRLSDDMPPTLADPHQLQQVFVNIINNASDALTEQGGGRLVITTGRREKNLKIVFEDDGPGISRENVKRLFDPFFTTKEVGKGTGLGLSIAYGIIEAHGGTIEVESEPGRGARFTVEIRISRGKTKGSTDGPQPVGKVFAGKSVLIVDDEAPVRGFISELMVREGCTVRTASTAEDAISLIGDEPFDAVLADIRMPGMDGMQFYSHIVNNYPEVSKRILFITGDTLSDEIQVFLRESNTEAITKPFTIDQLLTGLCRVFEG
jgi:two-component system, NtrC family, sensor kinase